MQWQLLALMARQCFCGMAGLGLRCYKCLMRTLRVHSIILSQHTWNQVYNNTCYCIHTGAFKKKKKNLHSLKKEKEQRKPRVLIRSTGVFPYSLSHCWDILIQHCLAIKQLHEIIIICRQGNMFVLRIELQFLRETLTLILYCITQIWKVLCTAPWVHWFRYNVSFALNINSKARYKINLQISHLENCFCYHQERILFPGGTAIA